MLVDRLAAFAVDRPDKWDRLLPSAIATLNTGVHVGHHLQSGGRASEPDQKEMEYLSGSCRPAEKILRPDLCREIHRETEGIPPLSLVSASRLHSITIFSAMMLSPHGCLLHLVLLKSVVNAIVYDGLL